MLARRVATGFGAVALLAVAGFVPAAASPRATNTICVGLIIDPRSIGGSVSAQCVTVKPGASGAEVLTTGGHSLGYRRDGLICTIDGLPKSGCSDVDNTHYWAYFHRAPDATVWHRSNEGANTYQPVNRSTEGWVYDDGEDLQPENVPAKNMCAALLKPKPTPSPTATKTPRSRHSPTPAATASRSAAPTSTPATKGGARHHRLHRASPSPSKSTPTEAAPKPSPTVASIGNTSGHGSATGALVAAGVLAAIAIATLTASRRRRP